MDLYQRVFGVGLNRLNKINNNYLTAKVKSNYEKKDTKLFY